MIEWWEATNHRNITSVWCGLVGSVSAWVAWVKAGKEVKKKEE